MKQNFRDLEESDVKITIFKRVLRKSLKSLKNVEITLPKHVEKVGVSIFL